MQIGRLNFVEVEKVHGRYTVYIVEDEGIDIIEGPNFRTKKHAKKFARKLADLLRSDVRE